MPVSRKNRNMRKSSRSRKISKSKKNIKRSKTNRKMHKMRGGAEIANLKPGIVYKFTFKDNTINSVAFKGHYSTVNSYGYGMVIKTHGNGVDTYVTTSSGRRFFSGHLNDGGLNPFVKQQYFNNKHSCIPIKLQEDIKNNEENVEHAIYAYANINANEFNFTPNDGMKKYNTTDLKFKISPAQLQRPNYDFYVGNCNGKNMCLDIKLFKPDNDNNKFIYIGDVNDKEVLIFNEGLQINNFPNVYEININNQMYIVDPVLFDLPDIKTLYSNRNAQINNLTPQ